MQPSGQLPTIFFLVFLLVLCCGISQHLFMDPFTFHSCNSAVCHPRRVSEGRIDGMCNPSVHNWCSWLRHCATSRKVAGSIPNCQWNFSLTQSFRPHLLLRSTQPLTEMSTRDISWGGGERRPVPRADNLITFTC